MKPKKASADWYIAATHWLTATISMVAFSLVVGIILAVVVQDPAVILIGLMVIYPLMMWYATIYSARFLDKTYVIKNADQIVILSTIYIVIVGGGYRIMHFLSGGEITPDHVGFILAIIVFYFASKKYLKNNTEQSPFETV